MTGPLPDVVTSQDQPRWFVVCGDDSLAYRLTEELRLRHGAEVTVILRSRRLFFGPRIAKLDGVVVVEADRPDETAFAAARLDRAEALALVSRDDVANVDAALLAHEINPDVRVIVRMFNTSLGAGIAQLPYLTVLSDTEMAAPAFLAAAIGGSAPRVGVLDNSLYVAHRDDVRGNGVLCGLAITTNADEPELIPADQAAADLVLVRARRDATSAPQRRGRLRHHYPVRAVLLRIWKKLRIALGVFAGLLVLGTIILARSRPDMSWWEAAYASVLIAVGGGDPNLDESTIAQVAQTVLAVSSLAMIPLITGAVVDAVIKLRLELAERSLTKRAANHVIVVGLGGVGSHVVRQLHDMGLDVVTVDRSPEARGAHVVRELDIPFIVGDASRRDTLLAASLQTCRALMALTPDDATNLQTALVGRSIHPRLPVVLRLFDGDFADRIQRAFDINTSLSVSYLAAPSFAARMLGQATDTIAIGRHVLLVAQLTIEPYSALEGQTVNALRRPGEAWVLEVANRDGQRHFSSATSERRLQRADLLLVVATREGLARLIAEAGAQTESVGPAPITPHDGAPYDHASSYDPPRPRHSSSG